MEKEFRESLEEQILKATQPFDVLLDPKFVDIYRDGWRNKHGEIEEGKAEGVAGARSLAGILALVRDPDFMVAVAEYFDRMGMAHFGAAVREDIKNWRADHEEQFRTRAT